MYWKSLEFKGFTLGLSKSCDPIGAIPIMGLFLAQRSDGTYYYSVVRMYALSDAEMNLIKQVGEYCSKAVDKFAGFLTEERPETKSFKFTFPNGSWIRGKGNSAGQAFFDAIDWSSSRWIDHICNYIEESPGRPREYFIPAGLPPMKPWPPKPEASKPTEPTEEKPMFTSKQLMDACQANAIKRLRLETEISDRQANLQILKDAVPLLDEALEKTRHLERAIRLAMAT